MAHGGELVAKMEWLLQEVDKKNDELMRKTSEVDHLRQEAARLLSATGQDGSSGHLAVQVQETERELAAQRESRQAKERSLTDLRTKTVGIEASIEQRFQENTALEQRLQEVRLETRGTLRALKKVEKEVNMKGAKIKGQEERMAEKERQLGIERQRSDMNSRTVKDLEVQVAHLEQKRRLMKDLGDELEKHATMLFDREEQIERAEAATAQLKSEQETVRGTVAEVHAEASKLRAEKQRRQQALHQVLAETEGLARENMGTLHAKRQLDAEQVERLRELEHVQHVHSQRTRQRDDELSALKDYQAQLEKQNSERSDIEQAVRTLEATLQQKRSEAERHDDALRKADKITRQRTQAVEQLLEQKQLVWQRADQERDRIKEESKRRRDRELGALFNRLQIEEQRKFDEL